MSVEKLMAARDLLVSTRRTLQLVDEEIDKVKEGRIAVAAAGDVSSEHRVAWFGAVDDNDKQNGIKVFDQINGQPSPVGFENPYRGTIRVQEDAAFVCTRVLVATRAGVGSPQTYPDGLFYEEPQPSFIDVLISLTDGNTGRNLTPGITVGPFDRDRGAVPLAFLSSFRPGLGSNFKNSHFSEFTIPRAGTVRVTAYNTAEQRAVFENAQPARLFLTLFGYKVYGA